MRMKMLRVFLFFLLLFCFWGLCSFFSFITPMSEIRIASLNMNGARDRLLRSLLGSGNVNKNKVRGNNERHSADNVGYGKNNR